MKNSKQTQQSTIYGLVFIFLTTTTFFGCKKKDPEPDANAFQMTVPHYPQPTDADAILVAVKATTPSPVDIPSVPGMPGGGTSIDMEIGMGIALFKGNTKADKVLLNNTELTFKNGVYMWLPDLSNLTNPASMTGINLNGSINWQVTNPNIQQTLNNIPGKPQITSGKTVTRAEGYTLTHQFSTGSSKILYGIYSGQKYIHKELNAGSTQCVFTAAELAELGSTKNGIIQVNAYTISDATINGKKVYFIRQHSYSVTGVEIK